MNSVTYEKHIVKINNIIPLERRECARNSGVAIVIRLPILFLLLLSLGSIFVIPGEVALASANNIKSNLLLTILFIVLIPIFAFSYLPNAFALNNVFSKLDKKLSLSAGIFRGLEGVIFIIGLFLLFSGSKLFTEFFILGYILYGVNLILVGNLLYKSGYLNFTHVSFLSKFLGLSLMLGGSLGYILAVLSYLFEPSLLWLAFIALIIAFSSEIILGLALVTKARSLIAEQPDPKKTITNILNNVGEATTEEIVNEAYKISKQCKDRVPGTLKSLEKDKLIVKRISKEKRAIVWSLA